MVVSSAAAAQNGKPDPLAILSSVGEAVYDWDLLTDALRWSPNAATVLGIDDVASLATGRGFHERIAALSASSRRDAIMVGGRSDTGGGVPYQIRYALHGDIGGRGDLVWIDDTGRWFAGPDGRPAQAHGLIRVAPARGVGEKTLPEQIDLDPLTGCVTRARLLQMLGTMLDRSAGKASSFGLLMIGMDGLAECNRRYGYDAVDEMIRGVADVLRTQIRSTDCLARYAGNKFALVLGQCDPSQIALAAARAIDLIMAKPICTSGPAMPAQVRVGGVLAPRHGRVVHTLLLNAETALDETSRTRRFQLFDPTASGFADTRRASDTAADIVAALNEGRVRLAFQPIVAARTGEPVMAEALLRIVMPDGSMLEPAAILPAAAKADLMRLLDQRVFDLVVAQLLDRARTLSLNVSADTLRDADWPARVAAAMRINPGAASRLIFEVSEAAAMADLAESSRTLAAVASLGVRIAIDHFGAGHASVRALRTLKPDFLKIDGAFVQNLARSPDDRFLVRSLIAVARQIGAPVIAEWVENAGAAATLADWGAGYMQGMHFGKAELPTAVETPIRWSQIA